METVRSWLVSVLMVSMLLSVVRLLTPKGSVQKISAFTGGLLLLLALLRPLVQVELTALIPDLEGRQAEIRRRQEELAGEEEKQLEQRIAERTAAYISDKAESLGLQVSARVRVASTPEGVPLPAEVELTGPYTPELAAYIRQELGIPGERQVWREKEH